MDSGRFFIEQIRFQKQKRKFFAKQNYFGLEKQDTDLKCDKLISLKVISLFLIRYCTIRLKI
jgi:hypothetical protein